MRQVDQKPIRAREGHHTMKRSFAIVAALLYALVAGYSSAQPGELGDFDGDDDSGRPLTVAVFGDWPYSLPLVRLARSLHVVEHRLLRRHDLP
jgi:hypothetical protein